MDQKIPVISYNQKSPATQIDNLWWMSGKTDIHASVIACCRAIESRQSYRRHRNVVYAKMYSNQFLASLNGNIYARPRLSKFQETRVTLNVVKACVDTVSSKIAKNKPRPLFLTEKGNFNQRQRAQKLTQYVSGVFKNGKVYQASQAAFRDSGIFGSGFIKLTVEENEIQAERILPSEIIVDDSDSVYGKPRTLYHRRFVNKELVAQLWGDDDKKRFSILACPVSEGGTEKPEFTEQSNMIYVVEAWHLPSSSEAKDGKHVICIENQTLVEEPYNKNYFPVFATYWTPPVIGYYGSGIVEEISGLQLEINKILRDLQQAQHKMCAPQIWIKNSTHVSKPITNEIGAVYRYTDEPPTFYAPSAMASEVYNHVWNLYRRAFEIVGVSELSATLRKPAGLESRVALREFNEIETERFALVAQAYEQLHMDIANAIVDMSRDLFKENKDLSSKVPGRGFIQTIEWKEADLEADQYVMEVFPTALLPNTPSGKLDRVQELIEGGLIDREYALSLLDFPDLEQVVSLETASLNVISMMIDNILIDGEYRTPNQFMDLALATKLAQTSILQAQIDGVEEEKIEMLRKWLNQCITLQLQAMKSQQITPAAPSPQVGQTGAPQPQVQAAPAAMPQQPSINGAAPVQVAP